MTDKNTTDRDPINPFAPRERPKYSDLEKEFVQAEAERDEYRRLLIRCVNEGTDGFAGDAVSLEFLRGVPAECAGMKRDRDEFAALVREYAASETPEAMETMERDRDRWAKRAERIERETIERCAKVADARDLSIMSSTAVDASAREIAAAIRAMREGGHE
jgi:hypothetical protein